MTGENEEWKTGEEINWSHFVTALSGLEGLQRVRGSLCGWSQNLSFVKLLQDSRSQANQAELSDNSPQPIIW